MAEKLSIENDYITRLFFADLKNCPSLTENEKEELIERYYRNHDEEARKRLIEGNLRLVLEISKRFAINCASPLDVFQEGCIGLINGIRKFNPDRGIKLSTYIGKCIENSIKEARIAQFRTGVSPKKYNALAQYNYAVSEYAKEHGTLNSIRDKAEALNLSLEKVASYEQIKEVPVSYNQVIIDEDSNKVTELLEMLPDVTALDPEKEILKGSLTENIMKALNLLTEQQRTCIILKYLSRNDRVIPTDNDIAEKLYHLGITDHLISQQAVNCCISLAKKTLARSKYLKNHQYL